MSFSAGFLEAIVWVSLVWCACSAIGLGVMLVRDGKKGSIW